MTVEERLERLERQVKRYRNALVLLVMSVCAVGLIGASPFWDTERGSLYGSQLFITSPGGKLLLYAGTDTDNDSFFFEGYNKTGESVVKMYADEYGNGVVYAGNRKGKGRTLEPGP